MNRAMTFAIGAQLSFFVLVLCLPAFTSTPLQFPDRTIPVPEGTPIIEYAPVPMEERTERIELVEDLVIRPAADSACSFYRPGQIAVGPDGRIYVVDSGNHCVHVFSDEGDCLFTIGREGQGPGELSRPRIVTIAGELLVVSDGRELSTWTLDGEHRGDHQWGLARPWFRLSGSDAGILVAQYRMPARGEAPTEVMSGYSTDGEKVVDYATLVQADIKPFDPSTPRELRVAQSMVTSEGGPTLGFTVSSSGVVYLTPTDEYQVLSMDPAGELRWALRVEWPRAPYSGELIDMLVEQHRLMSPGLKKTDLEWPERQRALSALRIDGHGRVFVFPIAHLPPGDEGGDMPVDVYSSEGELLFAGLISGTWSAARGEHVYRLRQNDEVGEFEIVRYRLVEPF